MTAHDGDAHVVRILFFRAELAHHLREKDYFAEIVWDVVKMGDAEGVGAFGALAGACCSFAYALAQAAYRVAVQGVPRGSHFGMVTGLAVFQVLAGVMVKDREVPLS